MTDPQITAVCNRISAMARDTNFLATTALLLSGRTNVEVAIGMQWARMQQIVPTQIDGPVAQFRHFGQLKE